MTAAKSAPVLSGQKVLCYGPKVRLLGWVLLAMVTPLVVFFLMALWHLPSNQIPLTLTVAVFILMMPVALLIEFYGIRVAFDERGIHTHSWWRGSREIPWRDIVSCKYSTVNRWYVIGTNGHGNIRVSNLLSGTDEFLAELKHKTGVG
jgi:hypothetical protein